MEVNPFETAEFIIKKVGVADGGVIESFEVGLTLQLKVDDSYTKQELVDEVIAMEKDGIAVSLKTETGTEVILVKDGDKPYFRTKGDDSKDNDLLDLPRSE